MAISVREALRLPALRGSSLLAGAAGLDRLICSVNIMEVPHIAEFVKKDELLLTTVYPIKDDQEAQGSLVRVLAGRGLAALAIKPVAAWMNDIPPAMVRQAEEMGFPLIKLPADASFNEIINPILGAILNRQAMQLMRGEEVHKALTGIVLDGGGLPEIAQLMSSLLTLPVSIHNSRMRLMAFSSQPLVGSMAQRMASDTTLLAKLTGRRCGQVRLEFDGMGCDVTIHPVTVARENYAYLLVWHDAGLLQTSDMLLLEQAATVVALEVAKLRAVSEVEKRYATTLIHELIQGRIDSRADALSRGELFGWDLSPAYIPLLTAVDDVNALYSRGKDNQEMVDLLRQYSDSICSAAASVSAGSIAVDLGDMVFILLRAGDDRSRGTAKALEMARRIRDEALGAGDRIATISMGVGRCCEDITALGTAFQQARQALEVSRLLNGDGGAMHYDDLGVYRILADQRSRPELVRFATDLLGDLVECDRRTKADLVRTLEVVLWHNGNLRLAAKELFIHYNTLRYRVSRIEEITKLDLGSAEGRLNLQIGLKILRMADR